MVCDREMLLIVRWQTKQNERQTSLMMTICPKALSITHRNNSQKKIHLCIVSSSSMLLIVCQQRSMLVWMCCRSTVMSFVQLRSPVCYLIITSLLYLFLKAHYWSIVAPDWVKVYQPYILAPTQSIALGVDALTNERNKVHRYLVCKFNWIWILSFLTGVWFAWCVVTFWRNSIRFLVNHYKKTNINLIF